MWTFKKFLPLAALWLATTLSAPAQPAAPGSVLVLYDSSGPQGWIGAQHATLLANLMGHFDLPCQIEPVENYHAGDLRYARATFYLGLVYDNPLPAAFTNDVFTTANPVCWFKYNLWHVSNTFLAAKYGFNFSGLDESGHSNIVYKGESFSKNQLDPELGQVSILDATRATVPMMAWRTNVDGSADSIAYVTHSGKFWYIADSPFDFATEEDRYVAFADLLHDILGMDAPASHRAIIRIEDVAPEIYKPEELRAVADLLHSNNVPFTMALIPVYTDPLGAYHGGIPVTHHLADTNDPDAAQFLDAVRYAVASGGQIIIHGYTHQYGSTPDPFSGTSGDDFEFWRETLTNSPAGTPAIDLYAPVPEDSEAWAYDRIRLAKAELSQAGLGWVAWEPPHYAASAVDYHVFATNFSLTMQRVLYFDAAGHSSGQFFPYVIDRDAYGQKVVPENLGNFEPSFVLDLPARSPGDIIRTARKNLVVRDGWANSFFHGFLDLTNLQAIVSGIRGLGYTYVPLSTNVPPSIVMEPQGTETLLGSDVLLGAGAVGTAPLTYQWRLNDAVLNGAKTASLALSNIQYASAGDYDLVVTNKFGAVTSYVASVTLDGPPFITGQPDDLTNLVSTLAEFQVTAIGSGPLAYQWQVDGEDIPDATSDTLDIDDAQSDEAGDYTVIVSNSFGSVTSSVATLTVVFPPTIITPPQDRTSFSTTATSFTVEADGTGPMHYQWRFNGNTIAGQTGTNLLLVRIPLTAAGAYDVIVTNAYGAITSSVALLTVIPAVPVTITAQPQPLNTVTGTTAIFNVTASGSDPLAYQWRFNNVNIPGATDATLTLDNVQMKQAGSYTVMVTNQFGVALSRVAVLGVGYPPVIVSQPLDRTNLAGSSATFSSVAVSPTAARYQWRFNDSNIAGAIGPSVTIPNVQSNNAGEYAVVVTNIYGAVTSAPATLTVNVPARILTQPKSQLVLEGTDAMLSVVAIGTGDLGYQWRFNGVNIPGATDATLVVGNLQTASAGNYSVLVSNGYGLAASANALLTLGHAVAITTQPADRTNLAGTVATFTTTATGTAPLHYQWQFSGTNLPGAMSPSLSVLNVQSNNAGDYTVVVSNLFGAVTSDPATLTVHVPAKIISQPLTQTVLAGTDAFLAVGATGTDPLKYQWRFNSVNIPDATNALLVVSNMEAADAGSYTVFVTNNYGIATSIAARLTLGLAVNITKQPLSRTNLAGSVATFSVAATGTSPLHYQWQRDGTDLPGATAAALTVANVQAVNAGDYTVVVTNIFGALVSSPATLTVHVPAKIVTQPRSQMLLLGTDALLAVAATGTDPLTYQWRFNGVNIEGENGATLSVTDMESAKAGNYSVVVTNAYGLAISANALISLGLPVTITAQPADRTNIAGTVAGFSVVATGTGPLHYQWQFQGTNLPGATAAVLNVFNVQSNNAGVYSVTVSNVFGAVASDSAALTVNVPARVITPPQSHQVALGHDAFLSMVASGNDPLAYQWRFNGVNIPDATDSQLTVPNFQATNAGYYSVLVSNSYGTATSVAALLTIGYPVTITTPPTSRTNLTGSVTLFNVIATGTPLLHYQWQFAGNNIAGATTTSLLLVNLQPVIAGEYTVVVSNVFGAVTSPPATLTLK